VGGVRPAFGSDLSSITQIAEQPKRMETRKRRMPDGAGGVYEDEFRLPVWFDAVAQGNTPMNAAFSAVVAPLRAWVSQHSASFPPIIINLTDGAYTDQSPAATVGSNNHSLSRSSVRRSSFRSSEQWSAALRLGRKPHELIHEEEGRMD